MAVSGGPDSTALLAVLAELASSRRLTLTVGHVDHALRGEDGREEQARVAALAARLGIDLRARRVTVAPGANLEARARRARYAALAAMARAVGATRIVTGHTQDDQVETLLLRLLRGTGRRGLGGMRASRGRLFRPMLGASRADVRRYLADRALPACIDRTNADLRHARNRVRRLLVPILTTEFNPRLGPSLAALAERLRDEDEHLDELATARAQALAAGDALSVAVAGEPRALARRVVRAWLERGARRAVDAPHVERVLALAEGRARGVVAVPGPARVLRESDHLYRRPGREPRPEAFAMQVSPGGSVRHPRGAWSLRLGHPRPRRPGEDRPMDPSHALFDAAALPTELRVRGPAAGDRVRLTRGGTRKLQDVLVDAKVPREARPAVPLLVAGAEVLWVAGVVRGAGALLGPRTTDVVEAVLVGRS